MQIDFNLDYLDFIKQRSDTIFVLHEVKVYNNIT